MTHRHRQDYIENGAIASPDPWNRNQREFAAEHNGMLDRDNLPKVAVDYGRMQDNCCNRLESDNYDDSAGDSSVINGYTTEWQKGDTNVLGNVEFFAEDDGDLVVEFGGYAVFSSASYIHVGQFRVVVNGEEVAISGYLSSRRVYDDVYLVGAIPVSAGNVVVEVEGRYVAAEQEDGEEQPTVRPVSTSDTMTAYARELVVNYERR